jgi:hypothetical protein
MRNSVPFNIVFRMSLNVTPNWYDFVGINATTASNEYYGFCTRKHHSIFNRRQVLPKSASFPANK